VDDTSTRAEDVKRAHEQLTEFAVLLGLTAERLYDLQRDFGVLQDQMVKCYAMLGLYRWNHSRVRSSHLPIFGAISSRRRPVTPRSAYAPIFISQIGC
jgi:hypothetical protein